MPDHMRAVFVHALDECPPVILPEYVTSPLSGLLIPTPRPFFIAFLLEILTFGLDSGTTLQAQKGHIVLTPYAVVQQLLTMGLVELV